MRLRRRRWVWLLVVNAASVSTRPHDVRRVIRRVASMKRPDFVFLSEVADVRLADLVDQRHWQVIQFGELGSPDSGTALMVRRSRARVRGERLVLTTSAGEGIRSRFAVVGEAQLLLDGTWSPLARLVSGHIPPDYAPVGQHNGGQAMASLIRSGGPVIVGADWNMTRGEVAARTGLPMTQVRMIEVLGVAGTGVQLRRARRRRVYSDHPGVTMPVEVLA